MTSENKICILLRSDQCHLRKDTVKKQLQPTLVKKSKVAALLSRQWLSPIQLPERQHQKPRRQCLTDLNEEEEHNEKSTTKKRPKNGQKQKKKEEILNGL